jgi:hypothetical protein
MRITQPPTPLARAMPSAPVLIARQKVMLAFTKLHVSARLHVSRECGGEETELDGVPIGYLPA